MLKKALLASTALVLCVSIALAGQKTSQRGHSISFPDRQPGNPVGRDHRVSATVMTGKAGPGPVRNNVSHYVPHATFNNFSKDRNAEFISWYGFSAISEHSRIGFSGVSYYISEVASNAVPIIGTGKKVMKIVVPIFSETGPKTEYNVGIYSATPSGLPGSLELAGGSATTSDTEYCCTAVRSVDVDVTLKRGQEYFLEVTCGQTTDCVGGWDLEDTDFSGSAQDYFRYKMHVTSYYSSKVTNTWSSSSPWHLSTMYPEQPAAIVK